MQYRGVKIKKVQWVKGIDIGKRENSPVKNIMGIGYSYIGGTYPMELQECYESIDRLIKEVMDKCNVSEKEAVKLINDN
jgi:hypothetical protein